MKSNMPHIPITKQAAKWPPVFKTASFYVASLVDLTSALFEIPNFMLVSLLKDSGLSAPRYYITSPFS